MLFHTVEKSNRELLAVDIKQYARCLPAVVVAVDGGDDARLRASSSARTWG